MDHLGVKPGQKVTVVRTPEGLAACRAATVGGRPEVGQ